MAVANRERHRGSSALRTCGTSSARRKSGVRRGTLRRFTAAAGFGPSYFPARWAAPKAQDTNARRWLTVLGPTSLDFAWSNASSLPGVIAVTGTLAKVEVVRCFRTAL